MFASDTQCRKISLHQEISIQLHCSDYVNQQAFENLRFVRKFLSELNSEFWEWNHRKSFLVKFFQWFRVDLLLDLLWFRTKVIIEWPAQGSTDRKGGSRRPSDLFWRSVESIHAKPYVRSHMFESIHGIHGPSNPRRGSLEWPCFIKMTAVLQFKIQ